MQTTGVPAPAELSNGDEVREGPFVPANRRVLDPNRLGESMEEGEVGNRQIELYQRLAKTRIPTRQADSISFPKLYKKQGRDCERQRRKKSRTTAEAKGVGV